MHELIGWEMKVVKVKKGMKKILQIGINIQIPIIIISYYHQKLFYDNDWNMVEYPASSSKIHLAIQITYCQTVLTLKLHFSSCQKNPKDKKKIQHIFKLQSFLEV